MTNIFNRGYHFISSNKMKFVSLVGLVLQTCTHVLFMRYALTRKTVSYSFTSVVVSQELVKISVCMIVLLIIFYRKDILNRSTKSMNDSNQVLDVVCTGPTAPNHIESSFSVLREVYHEIFNKEGLKLFIPALCYTLQNNLSFVALENLDAATFQVTYQFKLLVTALLMALILGKKLTKKQWFSLLLLLFRIILTRCDKIDKNIKKHVNTTITTKASNTTWGLIVVTICCFTSAFASVYLEKIFKTTSVSIITRNLQLAIFSSIISFIAYMLIERKPLTSFFNGYDKVVLILIMLNAFGGFLVAMVMKYADNILKGFSTAISIVICGIISYLFFEFIPKKIFIIGSVLVVISIFLYN